MFNDIQLVLENQHRQINVLLIEVVREGPVDPRAWATFRDTLHRHMGIEEQVLMRWLREAGVEFALADQLHAEHRRIRELLEAEPTVELVKALSVLINDHEALEESDIGLFAVCANTLDEEALVRAVQEYPALREGTLGEAWPPPKQAPDLETE